MNRLLLALLLLAGCSNAPKGPETGPKELFVEAHRSDVATTRLSYPFAPETEARSYVVVRSLAGGRDEVDDKLRTLIGQRPDPEEGPQELDLSGFKPRDPPTLLYFPDASDSRPLSACYVGHAIYARPVFSPGSDFVHHLRLLVVNREASPLRIPLREVSLERPTEVDAEVLDAVVGTRRELVAAVGHSGGRIETLEVPPGATRLAHVFFFDSNVPQGLLFKWRAEFDVRDAVSDRPQVWEFEATLVRRYILNGGIITPLEGRIAREEELFVERRALDPWQEPRLSATVGAPADPGPGAGE